MGTLTALPRRGHQENAAMSSFRLQRVNELLKRALGEILRRDIGSTESGLLNVNEVVVAGDLKSAHVYVGVIGSESQKKRSMEVLKAERVRI